MNSIVEEMKKNKRYLPHVITTRVEVSNISGRKENR